MRGFQVAGGSVTGRAHAVLGRGNQDACAWIDSDDALVTVVCDGCSSGRHSEVGAQLGARLVAAAVSRGVAAGADVGCHAFWDELRGRVLDELRRLAAAMGGDLRATVNELLLFTVVGAVVGPTRAALFSLGDGLVVVNGMATRLGPFPGNEPPYLAYGLLGAGGGGAGGGGAGGGGAGGGGAGDGPRFVLHDVVPLAGLSSLLLGSDGAADLAERQPLAPFWEDDRCFANPDMVRRRLAVAVRPHGGAPGLADDAAVVVVRRERGASCASG